MLLRRLAGPLVLAACLGCVIGPSPDHSAWSQVVRPLGEPLVRITLLAHDSLGLELADSGYVAVVEHTPGSRPRFLYPSYDAEWELVPKGRATLRIPVGLLLPAADVTRPATQCIIQSEAVSVWSRTEGEHRKPAGPACGPVPFEASSPRRWRYLRPTFEFGSSLQGYLLVLYMHHTVALPTLHHLDPRADAPPVQVARSLGRSLVWPHDSRRYWEAALWVAR